MKSVELNIAYQIQKKFLTGQNIIGYKVGASNYASADFFNTNEIILGGLEYKNIHWAEVVKDYPIAEVELVSKIRIDNELESGYQLLNQYIGIECPFLSVDNPNGSSFVCIADNCSAGDLIIFQEFAGDYIESLDVTVNGKVIAVGSSKNLRFSIQEIIALTLKIIRQHDLPHGVEIIIATGGLTGTFPLNVGDKVDLCCG